MNANQKHWSQQQKLLRQALTKGGDHQESIARFLAQHSQVHALEMAQSQAWSLQDEILADISEEGIRRIPMNRDHSIAWVLWHMTRVEDMTMNLLVAGTRQVYNQGNWDQRVNSPIYHSGNEMDQADLLQLSQEIDLPALLEYRLAVGRRTQEIAKQLNHQDIKRKVDPVRLQQITDEGAVIEAANGIIIYWGRRTFGGLLLMPATRHIFIHWNEAIRLKGGLQ